MVSLTSGIDRKHTSPDLGVAIRSAVPNNQTSLAVLAGHFHLCLSAEVICPHRPVGERDRVSSSDKFGLDRTTFIDNRS